MHAPKPRSDRRIHNRLPFDRKAIIRLPRGLYLSGVVRDISAMGAGIALDYEAPVPIHFRLQIPEDLFEANCVLRHCRDGFIGVEFTSGRAEALARYG